MAGIFENTIVRSGIKAAKYPIFASFVPIVLGLLEKFTEIEVIIPGLDKLELTGALFTVAGFIFVYDIVKHGLGVKLP